MACKRFTRLGSRIGNPRFNRAKFAGEAAFDCFKTAGNSAGAFIEARFGASKVVGDACSEGFAVTSKRFAGSACRVGDAGFD